MTVIAWVGADEEARLVANDQPLPVTVSGGGTLANGVETAVAGVAVQVAAASATRKALILQNTGAAAVRVGAAGVGATTGFRLSAGDLMVFSGAEVPTNAVFAIREGATDSVVLAQEMT